MIITLGEALIDMVPMLGEQQQRGFQPLVGGAVFNTAIGLGRLGCPVALVSGISTDLFGQQLVTALTTSQVNCDLLVRSALPTTLAFVHLQGGHASYTFYDENSAGRSLRADQVGPFPAQASCLYFGGISLASEPGADAFCELAERESNQRLVMLDPNFRPNFIQQEARYRARLQRLMALADVIKLSDDDLDWWVPGEEALATKVAVLRHHPQQWILVTRGRMGSIAFGPNQQCIEQACVPSPVIDTVGAGDAFSSGFLASLYDQQLLDKAGVAQWSAIQIQTALAFASRVAAFTVAQAGANTPWRHELNA